MTQKIEELFRAIIGEEVATSTEAQGAAMYKLYGGSFAAGSTPPTAFTSGSTGVSAPDWASQKVQAGAPVEHGPFGDTYPPAQVGGLLGIMGTEDETWKTILGG